MNKDNPTLTMMNRVWLSACADMFPLSVAVIPWGVLCGSLGVQMGLTPLQAQAMSLFVFAGAAQLSGVTMMGAGVPGSTLFGTTFVISARHLLYSVNFRQYIRQLPFRWRVALGFLLTDEMYALCAAQVEKTGQFDKHYALFSGAFFYLCWNLATLLGVLGGTQFENIEELGLEFAIAATFLALVIPSIKDIPVLVCVLVSFAAMTIFTLAGFGNALIAAALTGMMAGFVCESVMPTRSKKDGEKSK
ncbi:branched-chain amino acid ABC transporter permease [Grimontia sp. AD028]|uniref:AzlC family ABC transporter permease n=1 Tax=Grimontia sp. AD028 TaxID=1581149 RepID=UPI00061B3AD5|nr:AzlC family ABC transporter permease [Grimontia sp. AD028]KKD58876.1 branched-chain amino acid ABC transporter permease [Grimontia sp. AD028]